MDAVDEEVRAVIFTSPYVLAAAAVIPLILYASFRMTKGGFRKFSIPVVLRSLAVLFIILALAGLGTRIGNTGTSTVFVVDRSFSIRPETEKRMHDFIERSLESADIDDRAAIVVFGGSASLETSLGQGISSDFSASVIDRSSSNAEEALITARAALPSSGTRRIVFLSDGNINRGDIYHALSLIKGSGIEIISVPAALPLQENEVFIKNILAPNMVRQNETFEFTVTINSLRPSRARMHVLMDGEYLGEDSFNLNAGANSYTYKAVIPEKGMHTVEAVIEAGEDTLLENNRYSKIIQGGGRPRILYIHQENDPALSFLNALRVQDFDIISGPVSKLPDSIAKYFQYDCIILDNVPAYDLSLEKMELINNYVKNTGGGLLMIGGDSSFGLGGYYKTPIERLLPVDMDVSSPIEVPSLAMVFVIDKSGSMGQTIKTGDSKLDLVKEAVLSSVEVLNPYHITALLSFDADFNWTVEPTPASQNEAIRERLGRLFASGGTILYPALSEAGKVLDTISAAVKHMIVLSDGLTDEADFEQLVKNIKAKNITISTVSVGIDADRDLMRDIADWGGGRSYFTNDVQSVPGIFTSETSLVTRGLIVEEPFIPLINRDFEILNGIDIFRIPPLEGYVLTYPKEGSMQILSAGEGNPLLNAWRYGLGRSAAFTSDLRGKWGKNWLGWDDYSRFSSQLVRWLLRPPENPYFRTEIREEEGSLEISVNAFDADENFLNRLDLQAGILLPDGESATRQLRQTAPGLYRTSFSVGESGPYFITLIPDLSAHTDQVSLGYYKSYSEEYTDLLLQRDFLADIAEESGGTLIDMDEPEAGEIVFSGTQEQVFSVESIWFYLSLAALLLFTVEIVYRRVILTGKLEKLVKDKYSERNRRKKQSSFELYSRYTQMIKKQSQKPALNYLNKDSGSEQELSSLYITRLRKK